MKKILKLTSKDFYSGIAQGPNIGGGGLWYEARGINPFVDPDGKTREVGILQTSELPTDVTNSVSGTPVAYANDPNNEKMWYVATGGAAATGSIASVSLGGSMDSPTASFTGVYGLGTGMGLFKPSGAGSPKRYLYYFNTDAATATVSRIGRIDIDSAVTNTPDWKTDLTLGDTTIDADTNIVRPMIAYKDGLYFGHENSVGYIRDDRAGDVLYSANDLDLPADKKITCLSEDGNFLIIGATSNKAFQRVYKGDTRVYFYDTNQSSWSREWVIPDSHIYGLQRVGDAIYALTGTGVWVFNYQTRPVKIRNLDATQQSSSSTPYPASVSIIGNALAFGGTGKAVNTYGEVVHGSGISGLHTIFSDDNFTGEVTMVAGDIKRAYTIIGDSAGELHRYRHAQSGGVGLLAKSVYIPLPEVSQIKEVVVTLSEPLAAADELVVSIIPETLEDEGAWTTAIGYTVGQLLFNDGAAYKCISAHTSGASTEPGVGASWEDEWESLEFGTIDGANSNHVDRKEIVLRGSVLNVEDLGFVLGFEGGNPKIKTIQFNGIDMNYHA